MAARPQTVDAEVNVHRPAIALLLLILTLGHPSVSAADSATPEEMARVCESWLGQVVETRGNWAGTATPRISGVQEILSPAGALLGRCYGIDPRGYVVVPVLKDLTPIRCYSEDSDLDMGGEDGLARLVREDLESKHRLFTRLYGGVDAAQPSEGDVAFGREHRRQWDLLLGLDGSAVAPSQGAHPERLTQVGPLLTTSWDQGSPYYNFCPMGDGGRCVVGCVATAVAQIMRFHAWPPRGLYSFEYWWDGDDSCGGQTQGAWLYAEFFDDYDWANMPNSCGGGCTQAQRDALAELSYEVGVAFRMDYGRCGSGANTNYAITEMPKYFRYADVIDKEYRNSHSPESWFGIIQQEINNARPMIYTFRFDANSGHAVVCDGWRDTGGLNEYHINYGWGGSNTAWYTIDNIYPAYDPMSEQLYRRIMPSSGMVFRLRADGTGDFGTIQAAVDASLNGDTIELHDGTYTGPGNVDVDFAGKAITIRSRSGHPEACVIDCQGNPQNRRGFVFDSGEGSASVLEGLTIQNGYASGGGAGGAVLCSNGSSPTLRNCILRDNEVDGASDAGNGGAIACVNASPSFFDCVFVGNQATPPLGDGGAIYCMGGSPTLTGCVLLQNVAGNRGGGLAIDGTSQLDMTSTTLHANSAAAGLGGGLWVASAASVALENSILGFAGGGGAVACGSPGGSIDLSCCDLFGNTGGDWTGCIADQLGIDGNFSEDPLYCDPAGGNLGLTAPSPCTAENNLECGQVGAFPVRCGGFLVRADGTGDYPTIQAAIDAATTGFTIELADGLYTGPGNRDIDFRGKAVTVRSQSGAAGACVIDCGGTPSENHRAFYFHSGEGAGSVVSDLTITGGNMGSYSGGAIQCQNESSPTITRCYLTGNSTATASGGAINCYNSSPTISYCTFTGNSAGSGGAVSFINSSIAGMDHCTLVGNTAMNHGAGIITMGSNATITNTIIAYNLQGAATHCYTGSITMACCDVFGNPGGDWTGCIATQASSAGNLSCTPGFCGREAGDFHLSADSPCAADNNLVCAQIGALPVGCAVSEVADLVWAADGGRPLAIRPNPFSRSAEILWRIGADEDAIGAAITIHDLAGREVRRLRPEPVAPGMRLAVWDGRDERGAEVASGVYFVKAGTASGGRTQRIVAIR